VQAQKPMWESKTIMACVSALAAALMAITGHYTGTDPLPDQGLYSAFTSAVASVLGVIFRLRAEHTLTVRPRASEETEEPEEEKEPDDEPEDEESSDGPRDKPDN
jgi:hypothetical protein